MTDPTPIGRDHAVEAALTSLSDVGDRERQLLTPDAMAAIARAAAAERTRPGFGADPGIEVGHGSPAPGLDPLIGAEPLVVTGPGAVAPRPLRGRSALGLVAALLVVVGIGAAILAAAPQPVVTQDGASTAPAPEVDSTPPEAERPVLDLTELASTTTMESSDALAAGQAGETSTTAPPSPSPVESPTTPTTTSTSTTGPDPAPTEPTADPPAGDGPTDRARLAVEVGVGATVELAIADNQPEVGAIDLASGWAVETTEPRPGALGRRFSDDRSVAALEIWSEPGWFHLAVDHGDRWPSSTEWTRTITIDRAGTVDLVFGDHGLSGLEILLGSDWEHQVDTIGPDHLEVVLRGSTPLVGRDIRVDAGRTTVDIRITGP